MSAPAPPPAVLGERIPYACSIADVARFLNYSPSTIKRLLARHELPLVELARIGGQRRFAGRSVEKLLAGRWAK